MTFTAIHPKLPMRDKNKTLDFYCNVLGFTEFGSSDWDGYLMVEKEDIQIHFFSYPDLNPKENYGQIYIRCNAIEAYYTSLQEKNNAIIHPNGKLEVKPWGQLEFSILDSDNNLITFGESI